MRCLLATAWFFCIHLTICLPAWSQAGTESPGYQIGPKDELAIAVLEDDSLDTQTRVTELGTIGLPHVGEITVSGLTTQEAAAEITKALEKYLQRASVTVQVTDYRSRPISVIGAVKDPGRLPFSGRWTLLDAITEAGGPTAAAGDSIIVLRQATNGLSDKISIKIRDLYFELDPTVNIPVFANDVINVPEVFEIAVHCIGEVKNPGAHVFRSTEPITVVTAIAKAGGPTENAAGKVSVRRDGSMIDLNLKRMLSGVDPDFDLEEGDVIIVKEAFF